MAAAIILDDTTSNMDLYYNNWSDVPGVQAWPEGWDLIPSPHSHIGVLQEYACGSPTDQLFSHSPTCDVLQDSIWLETSNDIGPPADWFNDIDHKRRHPSSDDALQKVISPQELIFDYDGQVHTTEEFQFHQLVYDRAVELEALPENPHSLPVFVEDEPSMILESYFSVGAQLGQSRSHVDSPSSSASHSPHLHSLTDPLQSRSDVGVLQEVPNSPVLSLDPTDIAQYLYDADCESLGDPDSVFRILHDLSTVSGLADALTAHPILSPVSAEEVDSILLDGMESLEELETVPAASSDQFSTIADEYLQQALSPCSSESSTHSVDGSSIAEEYHQEPFTPKSSRSRSRSLAVAKPYTAPVTKREKKKEQNKTAAVRYRQKKQQEKVVVLSEVDKLELRNTELKSRVDDLNREISYLRGLVEEINRQ